MENEIDNILDDDIEETPEEETIETETKKKGFDLSFVNKPEEEWTTDDALAAKKAIATLKAQKEHFKNKATAKAATVETKEAKPLTNLNTEQTNTPNIQEEIAIALMKDKGTPEEDIEQMRVIQIALKAEGKSATLIDAQNHPLYKAYISQKQLEEKRNKAQIISSGSASAQLDEKGMEELESKRKAAAEAILSTM